MEEKGRKMRNGRMGQPRMHTDGHGWERVGQEKARRRTKTVSENWD